VFFSYCLQRESVKKPRRQQIYTRVHNQQNAVGTVVNYNMQFITGRNRHQMVFSTLDEQVTVDIPVRLMDALLAALNAKNTNAACKALYDRRGKGEEQKRDHYCRLLQVACARICGGKVWCAAPR